MIDRRNLKRFIKSPLKKYIRTHENIWKIVTGPGDDYTTGCLLNYLYFKGNYKLTTTEQINFPGILERAAKITCF